MKAIYLTHYGLLGVAKSANPKTIREAYLKAAWIAHPDRGGSDAAMAEVTRANTVLFDQVLRRQYDDELELCSDPCSECKGEGRTFSFSFASGVGAESECKACEGHGRFAR